MSVPNPLRLLNGNRGVTRRHDAMLHDAPTLRYTRIICQPSSEAARRPSARRRPDSQSVLGALRREVSLSVCKFENRFQLVEGRSGNVQISSKFLRSSATRTLRDVDHHTVSSTSPLIPECESLLRWEFPYRSARQDDKFLRLTPCTQFPEVTHVGKGNGEGLRHSIIPTHRRPNERTYDVAS